ncbi:MAG: aspartyl-phosphate phosphatase Spo0E family protein [Anaerobacillus sp.]|uniref:aspartyl-phosphate phosphatase Spo0E family protein n=1 Tax=Anaerobacillus sp. TaxID=1872506 RepID=UPI003919AA00
MHSQYILKCSIESKRRDMYEAANQYGMNAEITIRHSKELDELLNNYLRLDIDKEKKVEHYFSYKNFFV